MDTYTYIELGSREIHLYAFNSLTCFRFLRLARLALIRKETKQEKTNEVGILERLKQLEGMNNWLHSFIARVAVISLHYDQLQSKMQSEKKFMFENKELLKLELSKTSEILNQVKRSFPRHSKRVTRK